MSKDSDTFHKWYSMFVACKSTPNLLHLFLMLVILMNLEDAFCQDKYKCCVARSH